MAERFYGNEFFETFFQRELAAFRAMSFLRFLDSFFARATPPFNPPSLPRLTAAGFFSRGCTGSVVDILTISAASWFASRLLERFGIPYNAHLGCQFQVP